jgi:hypothetical protein
VQGPTAVAIHPTQVKPPNANVTEAAKFSALLDYRSLLNTNFKHGDGVINLFELAVHGFLADYLDLATNKTIKELWQAVLESKPTRNTLKTLAMCAGRCAAFNNAMQKALNLLRVEAQYILATLSPMAWIWLISPIRRWHSTMPKHGRIRTSPTSSSGWKSPSRGSQLTDHNFI